MIKKIVAYLVAFVSLFTFIALPGTAAATQATAIIASASQNVGAVNSSDFTNPGAYGARFYINVTNVGGAGTLTVKIQAKDPISLAYVDVVGATTASITTVSTTDLIIYPATIPSYAVANRKVADFLPTTYRAVGTVGTNAVIYSVSVDYMQ